LTHSRLAALAWSLGLGIGWLGCGGKSAVSGGSAAGGNGAREIAAGARFERAMRPGETHRYGLRLAAGRFVHVVVDQRGIDVRLLLYGPGGALLTVADSPTGATGPERVSAVAERAGSYRLEVVAPASDPKVGKYELRVESWREARPADRIEVAAERAFDRGEELRRAEQAQAALAPYQAALAAWSSIGSKAGRAAALYRLGWMRNDLEQRSAAVGLFREAAALSAEIGNLDQQAAVLNRMGQTLMFLFAFDEALAAHQQALALFRRLGDRKGEASSLNNLGYLYRWLGKNQLALDAYDAALALWDRRDDARERMKTLLNVGDLLTDEEQLDEAAVSYREGLRIATQVQDLGGLAQGLAGEATLLDRSGQTTAAIARLERALAYRRRLHDPMGAFRDLHSLGVAYLRAGDLALAADAFQRERRLSQQLGNRHSEATALMDLGRCVLAAGDLQKALAYHQMARPLFEATRDRLNVAASEHGSAVALYKLGRLQDARQLLEQSLASLEQLRGEMDVPSHRRSYFAFRQGYWELYVEVLMRLDERHPGAGYDAQAFALSERRRSRSLLDLLRTMAAREAPAAGGGPGGEEDALDQALNGATRLRLRLLDQAEPSAELAALDRLEGTLLARRERLQARHDAQDPRATAPAPPPLAAAAAESLLGDDEVLLEYSLGTENSYVWAVTRGACKGFRLAGRARIEAAAVAVARLAQRLSRQTPEAWEQTARELSALVLLPVAGELHHRRLLVAGDGALLYVPFAALPEPGAAPEPASPLIASHEVVAVPSASVLGALRHRSSHGRVPPRSVAVLADPVFRTDDPRLVGEARVAAAEVRVEGPPDLGETVRDLGLLGLARLPATRREALAIERVSPPGALVALDFAANKRLVLAGALRRFGYLHFATHGLIDVEHPELSGIVLSLLDERGRPQDGFLRPYEIYSLDLAARLVVLSGCETGLGEPVAGEGLVGLSWGFLHAGAERVLVSLWKVSDESTAELMRRFYAALFAGQASIPAALRQAQLSMRAEERWRSPYHWAGFTLQGD
jgi:CHAT domain-containing protein